MGANAEIFPLAKSFLLIRSISAPAELWYSIYWLYWHKSTYTDAEGGGRVGAKALQILTPASICTFVPVKQVHKFK